MTASPLPSINDHLVTLDNPPRTGLDGMDHARCAALHNYLVDYCLAADGRPDAAVEASRATYFSTHGDAAEALCPRLHPSVAAFLAAARTPHAPLFYFVSGMAYPNEGDLFDNWAFEILDEPDDTIVRLYHTHMDSCEGVSGGGLLYHQRTHLATFFCHPDDIGDYAFPVDEHPQLWHPLESILSHWIFLTRLGKLVVSPAGDPALYGGEKVGNWEWMPYSQRQVADCVAAWDRLCNAIEARRRQSRGANVDHEQHLREPLLSPAALDAAKLPDPSFARAFLGLARRPRHIRQIAPGLSLPPASAAAFAAAQPYTHLPRHITQWDATIENGIVPPVYIFFSAPGALQVDVSGWDSPFRGYWDDGGKVPEAYPLRVPPGIYSEGAGRWNTEPTEEGFRFLLPFSLHGARRSDGMEIGDSGVGSLFQHGFKPFGGNPRRPQRLERLLDHWAGLVERGVWCVGPHGVEGSIEVFKDATVSWADYTIPPSW
ncbi:hypothetical protein RB595_004899 [Gaeumannomyces hyphopodioides]